MATRSDATGDLKDPMAFMEQMEKWSKEPLLPELEGYVEESATFGKMLRHPLIYEIPLMLPGRSNEGYRQKKAHLEEAIREGDWHRAVFLHERPYRTWALIEYIVGRYDDEGGDPIPLSQHAQSVRDLAADVWVDSENLEQHVAEWDAMLADADGLVLASEREIEEFAALPDVLTLYRGDIEDGGYSWSLDPKIAHFFAHRFNASDPLVSGEVDKSAAIGYLSRRGESEVLVPRGAVRNVKPFEYVKEES